MADDDSKALPAEAPEEKNKGGRPSMKSEERCNLILNCLRSGCTREGAAAAAGITSKTLNRWEHGDAVFAESVRLAIQASEATLAAFIFKAAAEGDWRAARDLLAVRFPQRWSKRMNVEVNAQMNITAETKAEIDKVYGDTESSEPGSEDDDA